MAAEAAVGATAGLFLFGYNRGNYIYDSTFRYERFTSAREFAIVQTEQFRNDLRALSALTAKKNGTYAVVASLSMALCVALYCAGRLGLHGPSPPAWIMGLWLTNNAAAFSFMALTIWLAVHASYRAQAATAHLLTRKVRVPVPTLKQLDEARRYASEFEQQSWGDIFRVPYITNNGAPKTDDMVGSGAASAADERGGRARSAPPGGRRKSRKESTWIRQEIETDRAGVVSGPVDDMPEDLAPEHFRLYGAVQKEWYAYDIYARVCLLYGMLSFVHALAYYGLGHINIELRAFWVAYATAFVIMTLHALLLRFDIVSGRKSQSERLPHCQWLGPLAVLPAAIGMSLDFRVQFSLVAIAFTWICIFIAYILQFIYTLRLLEIVLPDDWNSAFRPEEQIGDAWWPASWRVPSTFQHVLYLVAPPQRLQPGQNDIVRDVKQGMIFAEDGSDGGSPSDSPTQREDLRAQMQHADRLFERAFSDKVFSEMSTQGQQQVRALYHRFTAARSKDGGGRGTPEPELSRIVKECLAGLDTVMAGEGARQSFGKGAAGPSGGAAGFEYGNGAAFVDKRNEPQPVFSQTQHIEPWRLVASIVLMLCVTWAFLIFGNIVDVAIGEQGLITAPHWSRPPMTRMSLEPHELGTPLGFPWPAGDRPFIPEQMAWHEEKREAHMDVLGRRLTAGAAGRPRDLQAPGPNAGLSTALRDLLGSLPSGEATVPQSISWPGFFEPQLLACGPPDMGGGSLVAALTPRGFGASARVGGAQGAAATAADIFKLAGITHLPPLLSASWGLAGGGGLLLVSRAGDLAACPGPRPARGGAWACGPPAGLPRALPVAEGARLVAAAAAWLSGPTGSGGRPVLHAALVDESAPDLAVLFALDGASWLPLGEVQVPRGVGGAPVTRTSLAFVGSGDLLVATDAGGVLRRRLRDGAVVASAPRALAGPRASWRAVCGLQHGPGGAMAHLHLRTGDASPSSRRPELVAVGPAPGDARAGNDAAVYL